MLNLFKLLKENIQQNEDNEKTIINVKILIILCYVFYITKNTCWECKLHSQFKKVVFWGMFARI